MSWGTTILGLSTTIDILQDITLQFDSDTVYLVGPTVEYAIYVELGTSRMRARPFVAPAARRVQENLELHVQNADGSDEEAILLSVALAVEREIKRVIKQKGLIDTGAMRASVSIEKTSG